MTRKSLATTNMLEHATRKARSIGFAIEKSVIQARFFLHPSLDKRTIFMASVQRSGTTMMMKALNRSFDTEVLFEWDTRAYRDCELRETESLRQIIKNSKAPHIAFKPLCDLHFLSGLLQEFNPAKAIWMFRNYHDVVNSHLERWTGMPESIRLMVRDRNSAGWQGRGMSDKTHGLIKKLYHPAISNASACALFWYLRSVHFFEQRLDRDPRVILARYEDLVTRPNEEFRRILDFLGLPYSPRISHGVFSTSIGKRRPPEIDPPIADLCDRLSGQFDDLMKDPNVASAS